MSLNKITSKEPIKQWMNIGANSIKCNSIDAPIIESDVRVDGNIEPFITDSFDIGGTPNKNWRAIYSRAVKNLAAPIDPNDAVNLATAQSLIAANLVNVTNLIKKVSGVFSQDYEDFWSFNVQAPTILTTTIGGQGTVLRGVPQIPGANGAVYNFKYDCYYENVFGSQSIAGGCEILLDDQRIDFVEGMIWNASGINLPFTISGTINFISGWGFPNTLVYSNLVITYYSGGTLVTFAANSKSIVDTSGGGAFKIDMKSSTISSGTSMTFCRRTGYLTNTYYPL